MKNIKAWLLPGCLILAAIAFKVYRSTRTIEIPKYGNYLSCVGHAYDLDIKLKGEVIVLNKALPENAAEKEALFKHAAFFQNLYAFTNLLEHNPNSPLKWVSFGSKKSLVTITKTESVDYPLNLEFNNKTPITGFPPMAENYLKKLMPTGSTSKGEPATKVSYEMESKLLTCFTEETPQSLSKLNIFHPIDPYLAYYYVPPSHHLKIVNSDRAAAEDVVNPCLNPGGITSSGFNPYGYWYFWRPEAQGRSFDQTPFDCSLFYKEGVNLKRVSVNFQEAPPEKATYFDFKKFDNLQRPIKFTFLVGGIEGSNFTKLNTQEVKKFVDLYLSDISLQQARSQLPAKYDTHFSKVLAILYKIKNHMEIFNHEVRSDELYADVFLKGKLKLSKKDIELKISLSPNDPRYSSADHFADTFAKDFLTSDIVIYEGHATTGMIFDQGLEKLHSQSPKIQDNSIAYQIFAIYSCSSSFYYHPERFPKVENPNFRRDVVRTAGAYADGGGNGSLGLLASLDQYLYNESYVPFAYWAKNYKSDNFYILTND